MHKLSEKQLKKINYSTLKTRIETAKKYRELGMTEDFFKSLKQIKIHFFDKKNFKRGYTYDKKTKLYTWAF